MTHTSEIETPKTNYTRGLGIAALGFGAVAAALVLNKRTQHAQISGHAVSYTPPENFDKNNSISIYVGADFGNQNFVSDLNTFSERVTDQVVFGYCINLPLTKVDPNKREHENLETLLNGSKKSVRSMASDLAALIEQASIHSEHIVVYCNSGSDILGTHANKLLTPKTASGVKFISLAATFE